MTFFDSRSKDEIEKAEMRAAKKEREAILGIETNAAAKRELKELGKPPEVKENLLPMKREGRAGEKAFHYHHWKRIGQDTFLCIRCGDKAEMGPWVSA